MSDISDDVKKLVILALSDFSWGVNSVGLEYKKIDILKDFFDRRELSTKLEREFLAVSIDDVVNMIKNNLRKFNLRVIRKDKWFVATPEKFPENLLRYIMVEGESSDDVWTTMHLMREVVRGFVILKSTTGELPLNMWTGVLADVLRCLDLSQEEDVDVKGTAEVWEDELIDLGISPAKYDYVVDDVWIVRMPKGFFKKWWVFYEVSFRIKSDTYLLFNSYFSEKRPKKDKKMLISHVESSLELAYKTIEFFKSFDWLCRLHMDKIITDFFSCDAGILGDIPGGEIIVRSIGYPSGAVVFGSNLLYFIMKEVMSFVPAVFLVVEYRNDNRVDLLVTSLIDESEEAFMVSKLLQMRIYEVARGTYAAPRVITRVERIYIVEKFNRLKFRDMLGVGDGSLLALVKLLGLK